MFAAFGAEWKPAAINSTQEFDDMFEGHRQLTDAETFWIYGTTDLAHLTEMDVSNYIPDDSGKYQTIFSESFWKFQVLHNRTFEYYQQ